MFVLSLLVATGCRPFHRLYIPFRTADAQPTAVADATCVALTLTLDGWPAGTYADVALESTNGRTPVFAGHYSSTWDMRFSSPAGGYEWHLSVFAPGSPVQHFDGDSPADCPPATSYVA